VLRWQGERAFRKAVRYKRERGKKLTSQGGQKLAEGDPTSQDSARLLGNKRRGGGEKADRDQPTKVRRE